MPSVLFKAFCLCCLINLFGSSFQPNGSVYAQAAANIRSLKFLGIYKILMRFPIKTLRLEVYQV